MLSFRYRHLLRTIRLLVLGLVLVLVIGTEPAYAFAQDWGGAEDDWSMPTGVGTNSPTTTACVAYKTKGQQCKDCATTYYDNGVAKPYQVCAWFAQSAGCSCTGANTAKCTGVGSCTYHG